MIYIHSTQHVCLIHTIQPAKFLYDMESSLAVDQIIIINLMALIIMLLTKPLVSYLGPGTCNKPPHILLLQRIEIIYCLSHMKQ